MVKLIENWIGLDIDVLDVAPYYPTMANERAATASCYRCLRVSRGTVFNHSDRSYGCPPEDTCTADFRDAICPECIGSFTFCLECGRTKVCKLCDPESATLSEVEKERIVVLYDIKPRRDSLHPERPQTCARRYLPGHVGAFGGEEATKLTPVSVTLSPSYVPTCAWCDTKLTQETVKHMFETVDHQKRAYMCSDECERAVVRVHRAFGNKDQLIFECSIGKHSWQSSKYEPIPLTVPTPEWANLYTSKWPFVTCVQCRQQRRSDIGLTDEHGELWNMCDPCRESLACMECKESIGYLGGHRAWLDTTGKMNALHAKCMRECGMCKRQTARSAMLKGTGENWVCKEHFEACPKCRGGHFAAHIQQQDPALPGKDAIYCVHYHMAYHW